MAPCQVSIEEVSQTGNKEDCGGEPTKKWPAIGEEVYEEGDQDDAN
jgi:hypothetical protein